MIKRKSTIKNKTKSEGILEKINPNDALAILKIFAEKDKTTAKQIEQIAKEYLSKVDSEEVASQVYFNLDSLEVEEVWNRSGDTQYGYIEPGEMAYQMMEEALESYRGELKKYQKLSMYSEAKRYCMGILKGIYRFEKESKSEYKNWAGDGIGECFRMILDDWKKDCKNKKDIKGMEEFVEKNFSDW